MQRQPARELASFPENGDPKTCTRPAEVAELADAQDLGSCGRKAVGVQLPPSALAFQKSAKNAVLADIPEVCHATRRIRGRGLGPRVSSHFP